MAVSYKKLWHILVDRNMKKKDLEEAAGITHYQMYKLANDKDITTDVIGAICTALEVEPNDIMDFVPEIDKEHGGPVMPEQIVCSLDKCCFYQRSI